MSRSHHDRHWGWHPRVRTGDELTFGEKAADAMRSGMGSWAFVFGFLVVMAIWMGFNRNSGFDPYPFVLLNLILSTMAGLQAAALLIAAKRADAISSQVALHTEQNTEYIRSLLEKNTALTRAVEELTKQVHASVCPPTETKS